MAKKSGNGKWIVLLLAILGAVAYFNSGDKPKETVGPPQQLYSLEKSGAATIADYTATARRVHAAVDNGLAAAKLTVQNVQETNRETPRQKVEGSIRWHTRQILLSVPPDTRIETVQQALDGPLKNSGGVILTSQPDNYQGLPVVRLDVGVRDSLEGDPLTLTTDRIYVTTRKKSEAPAVKPSEVGSGKLAIIIDDFGYSAEPINAFAAISRPLTFSVLPYRAYSNEAASRGLSSGHQVILHLPMEALSAGEQAEPTSITVAMADPDIQAAVNKAVQSVPGIIGVNNHQGSKATADRRVMRSVLSILKADNLFFVDSRTNSQSVAFELSRQMGLRTGENDLFIDNSADVEAIKNQLRTAIHLANQHGSMTVIGHARMSTATAVREMIPEIEAAGVRLVFESELVH
ncbi:MAG: divergent polysaccharide deacetylase family protein [Negativicutes bacterium]|nr:divergent polysaccharide deacetylase family protein [Negativicutes bacterium]